MKLNNSANIEKNLKDAYKATKRSNRQDICLEILIDNKNIKTRSMKDWYLLISWISERQTEKITF